MVSIELSEGITETLDILAHMEESYINKIPKEFKQFLEENKSLTYKAELDHTKSIKDMNLKDKTKSLLATIYMNYWCDAEQKEEFLKTLKQNEINKQKELNEKYSVENLFKKNKEEVQEIKEEQLPVVVTEKQNIFVKFINFVKKLFKK